METEEPAGAARAVAPHPERPLTAAEPFRFYTSLVLEEATGLRASTLPTLLKLLRAVPDPSIYHHTHQFVLQHHYLIPEPTNDFAYWVSEVLGEERLGEQLAGIDIMEHVSLSTLRAALADTIERYLAAHPQARLRFVSEGQEFFFEKSTLVVMPTPHAACTLEEFAGIVKTISLPCLYFHMFDARLRLGRPSNDFAIWISGQLGLTALGEHVARLDPYTHTLETIRTMLLALLQDALDRSGSAAHG